MEIEKKNAEERSQQMKEIKLLKILKMPLLKLQ